MNSGFDAYAEEYDSALQRGLSVSGESRDYFAQGRVAWLAREWQRMGFSAPGRIVDYGCGTGETARVLQAFFGSAEILGLDPSPRSIELARERFPEKQFELLQDHRHEPDADVVYCNGVFHHIPPPERIDALQKIRGLLRPGGLLSLWENNPWNPGARLVMHRVPFDHDAIMLWPHEARRLLQHAGFEVLGTSSQFFFPRALKILRPLENALSRTILGAQYQVLASCGHGVGRNSAWG